MVFSPHLHDPMIFINKPRGTGDTGLSKVEEMMVDPALYWLIIGVMLLVLGLVLPGFIMFFFAVGAMATALLAWLLPATAIVLQLGFFIAASLITLFCSRTYFQKRFFPSTPAEDGEEADERGDAGSPEIRPRN